MTDFSWRKVLIDGIPFSAKNTTEGLYEFEVDSSRVGNLSLSSCVAALEEISKAIPGNPLVDLTVTLENHRLAWENVIQALYIQRWQDGLFCEFHILTAIEIEYIEFNEKTRQLLAANKWFRVKSIRPIVHESLGEHEPAREWNIKITWDSDEATFGELLQIREQISRASFSMNIYEEVEDEGLLFRIYVPVDRLYSAEADRLLSLFRSWLSCTGQNLVRQDGYRTSSGQVYEFFARGSLRREELVREFRDFSLFLKMSVEDIQVATETLSRMGVERNQAQALVARYGKEARRLQLDLQQERESRLLTIRHSLESELLDASISPHQWREIWDMIDALVPNVSTLAPMPLLALTGERSSIPPVTVNVNQQFINAVESTVVQSVQGTTNLGAQAKDILDLINVFGGPQAIDLESAVYELEDSDARPSRRKRAMQQLKTFLLELSGKVEDAALAVLAKYIETRLRI